MRGVLSILKALAKSPTARETAAIGGINAPLSGLLSTMFMDKNMTPEQKRNLVIRSMIYGGLGGAAGRAFNAMPLAGAALLGSPFLASMTDDFDEMAPYREYMRLSREPESE